MAGLLHFDMKRSKTHLKNNNNNNNKTQNKPTKHNKKKERGYFLLLLPSGYFTMCFKRCRNDD